MYKKLYREDYVDLINKKLEELSRKKNIAIWGLGEYAEKIVIYSNILKYDIRFYVDDKRGGFFTGNTINTSKEIIWNNVEAVVITSYYKGEEIERYLYDRINYEGLIINLGRKDESREFYKCESRAVNSFDEKFIPILSRNVIFRDRHSGEKCIILGNGPSLNDVDLKRFSQKSIVFAVNNYYRQCQRIPVNYYVVADPFYFDPDLYHDYGKFFYANIKELEQDNKDICYFFPVQFADYLVSKGTQWLNTYYFLANRDWNKRVDNDVDLTKGIFGRYSVIQYCVLMAVYMGFKEIYLIGCEETSIYGTLDNYIDEGYAEYAFDIPKEQLNIMKEYGKSTPLEDILVGFANIYKGYKEMDHLCKAKEVKLYTCSKRTLVKNIEYRDYNDVVG